MRQVSVIQVRAKIFHPLGMLSGIESDSIYVLNSLAIEMMAHRSDLREEAARTADSIVKSAKEMMAENLENYATALSICVFQLMEYDRLQHTQISGLLDLSETHGLYLPDDLREKAEADRRIFADTLNKGAERNNATSS